MDGGNVDEEEDSLSRLQGLQQATRQSYLVLRRPRIGDTQAFLPVALRKHCGKNAAQRSPTIEKPNAADADRVVADPSEAADDIGGVENGRCVGRCFTPGEPGRKQPRMLAGSNRCREEAREKRVMRRVGEVARAVAQFPLAARQQACELGCCTRIDALNGHIVA